MVNLSDLSGGGGSSDSSSSGTTKIQHGYGGTGINACYVLQTKRSNGYGFTFFDQDFGSVAWGANAYTDPSYQGVSHFQDFRSGEFANFNSFFSDYSDSSSGISSSSAYYLNSFQNNQWGGAVSGRYYSTGSVATKNTTNLSHVHGEMKSVFNSDHTNKSIAYQLKNGEIRAVVFNKFGSANSSERWPDTVSWAVPGMNTDFTGTASYNKSLKKLFVVRQWSGINATYNCYHGVDFDTYPSPTDAMTASGVTVVTGTMTCGNMTGSAEPMKRFVPILCDDGNLWCVAFFPSNGVKLWGYAAVPTSDGDFSPNYITSLGTTTSYGIEQGIHYGRTMLESRDRKSILIVAPYYYYGSGCVGYALTKKASTNQTQRAEISRTSSSHGEQPLPWRDDGFCIYYAGNHYAGNYSGSYVQDFITRSSTQSGGGMVKGSNQIYLPYAGLANTTNYPGMSAVTDYDLLSYNNGVR